MSKSVDETVFDFFALLLQEDDTPSQVVSSQSIVTADSNQNVAVNQTEAALLDAAILAENGRTTVSKALEKTITPAVQLQSKATSRQHEFVAPVSKIASQVNKQALEKLLAPVLKTQTLAPTPPLVEVTPAVDVQPVVVEVPQAKPVIDEAVVDEVIAEKVVEPVVVPETQVGITPPSVTKDLQEVLDDEFQVLFFKVAGLTLAVPLVSLGGIVKIERINHIFGRPAWFLGVQTHREEQLNIVDTCAWVMPEKYSDKLAQSVNYQYLVLLEGSNWGLTCESLVNAVKINKSQVNWRSQAGKRPWLAGVVKEQMCGILHVQALVEMLNAGLGCQDSIG
ncbi:chemotaxis protein CheW [Shewanella baltica]|uniref:chemotaxis protein CheW n=1 Tax=Shewanella baltica TaxID=62322 RepID=UPI003D02C05C